MQNGQLTREALSAMMGGGKTVPARTAARPTVTVKRQTVYRPTATRPTVARPTAARPTMTQPVRSVTRPVQRMARPVQQTGRAIQTVQRPNGRVVRPARPMTPVASRPQPITRQPIAPKPVAQPIRQAKMESAVLPEKTLVKPSKAKNAKKSRLDRKLRQKLAGLLSLTIISAGVLGYLVYLNLPDISAKVSAMTVGIDTSFPSYAPAGYRLEGLPSVTDGRVVLRFVAADDGYTLTEEKSSLSSEALFDTVVKEKWPEAEANKERGLTIYINESEASWVNGGVLFTVSGSSKLTPRQIHNLAASLQ